MTLEQLTAEYRLMSSGDAWGDCMGFGFAIADCLYWKHGPETVPEEWQFRPSPLGPQNDPEDYVTDIIEQCDAETLLAFGKMLTRLASILKKRGKDY